MALGRKVELPRISDAVTVADATTRPMSPEELAILRANAQMVARARELAQAPSSPRIPTEPGPLGRRVAEQDALERRIDEETAILEMRMRRGQDVDASEIERLNRAVDPGVRSPPPSQVIEPDRLQVPYVPGTARPGPLGLAKGRDIVPTGPEWI